MPNCASGGDGDHANADYCHAPLQAIATKPCEACQGDCNYDSDCAGKLQCFQRSGNEAVPGCKIGGSGDRTEYDYCYEPFLISKGKDGCTSSSKCSLCEGDCDSDSHCKDGLKCFQRDLKTTFVPGCTGGGSGDVSDYDYCAEYDVHEIVNDVQEAIHKHIGLQILEHCSVSPDLNYQNKDFCTKTDPCEECFGDCDDDFECAGDMICFETDGVARVPGCNGLRGQWDTSSNVYKDYCVLPNKAKACKEEDVDDDWAMWRFNSEVTTIESINVWIPF